MHTNRRWFLQSIGGSALGAATLPIWRPARAQAERRRVLVSGRPVKVIDVHAHCVFPELEPLIAGTSLEGQFFAEFVTLGPDRSAAMDARGIDVQALSVNAFWWYEGDREPVLPHVHR